MSSPAPMPPMTPVPPPPQPRSYAGPVLLVMVGAMLLLTTTGVWSPKNFGIWFARYWPALIIAPVLVALAAALNIPVYPKIP